MAHQRTESQLGDACMAFPVSSLKTALPIDYRHAVEAKVSSRKVKACIHDAMSQSNLRVRVNSTMSKWKPRPMTTAQRWDQVA